MRELRVRPKVGKTKVMSENFSIFCVFLNKETDSLVLSSLGIFHLGNFSVIQACIWAVLESQTSITNENEGYGNYFLITT